MVSVLFVEVSQLYNVVMSNTLAKKKEHPGALNILCTIGVYKFDKASCDLGASINLMPY